MIICFLGNIGSGKSLSVVKEIYESNQFVFTNFELKGIKNYHRIRFDEIFKEKDKGSYDINWSYWNEQALEHKGYSICIDEIHNLVHSRRSMSGMNILMSKWVSQIRKILSDSEHNHLYIISQTIRKIDVDFRDLIHLICVCKAFKDDDNIWIKQYWYDGMEAYLDNKCKFKRVFLGNPYFKYYTSKKLVFGEDNKYI